jgi:hypothetical protein
VLGQQACALGADRVGERKPDGAESSYFEARDGALAGYFCVTTSSVRRFLARPSAVSFDVIGCS